MSNKQHPQQCPCPTCVFYRSKNQYQQQFWDPQQTQQYQQQFWGPQQPQQPQQQPQQPQQQSFQQQPFQYPQQPQQQIWGAQRNQHPHPGMFEFTHPNDFASPYTKQQEPKSPNKKKTDDSTSNAHAEFNKKPKTSEPSKKGILDLDDYTKMKLYDAFKTITDDEDLIKYWAFNTVVFCVIAADEKYRYGYFGDGGAHMHRNINGGVIVSTPNLKMCVTESNATFVDIDVDKVNMKLISEDVLDIMKLIREVIESSDLYSASLEEDVEDDEITETLEAFYKHIQDSDAPVVMSFASSKFTFTVKDDCIDIEVCNPNSKPSYHKRCKPQSVWSMVLDISDLTVEPTEEEGLTTKANPFSIARAIRQAIANGPNLVMDKHYANFINVVKEKKVTPIQHDNLITSFKYNNEQLHITISERGVMCEVAHLSNASTINDVVSFIDKIYRNIKHIDLPDIVHIRILLIVYINT